MSAYMEKKLREGHAFFMGLMIQPRDGKAGGPHATTVVNFRKKCCMGVCYNQYQLIDSLNIYWAPHENGNWVDEAYLFKLLPASSSLIWLEANKH